MGIYMPKAHGLLTDSWPQGRTHLLALLILLLSCFPGYWSDYPSGHRMGQSSRGTHHKCGTAFPPLWLPSCSLGEHPEG